MTLQIKVVLCLAFIGVVACDSCYYSKFTPLHSYCQPPNPNCQFLDRGLTDSEKELVVRLHNKYREKVALGKEKNAGHLPKAANMLEMVWDDELAAVAQKHADQCEFGHDCNKCREVDRFHVGQNIAMPSSTQFSKETDWKSVMESFYDEVSAFNKRYMKPYVFAMSYSHFTQVVWANTWRVGCGKVIYQDGSWYNTYIVCDYGPAGNMRTGEMYKKGHPCSACPSGTCCGNSCQQSGIQSEYRGLCKVIDEDNFSIGS